MPQHQFAFYNWMCQDEAMMAVRHCDHPSGDHIVAPTEVNQFSMKITTIKQAKRKLLKKTT